MTETITNEQDTPAVAQPGFAARVSAWVGRSQQDLPDRVHAGGDSVAVSCGWEITKSVGAFGFGSGLTATPRPTQVRPFRELAR